MDAERLWAEYSKLSPEAQAELFDFLTFLRQRHSDRTQRAAQQRIDWDNKPFVGMWHDRDDMADSGRWVREVRERKWSHDRR